MKAGRNMMKKLVAAIAAIGTAAWACAANVSTVEGHNATDSDTSYQATPVYSTAAHNLSAAGWYAGLKLTWDKNEQRATKTNVSVNDNISGVVVKEYTAGTSIGKDQSPSGSGLANTFTYRVPSYYMQTTDWYFCVTPEMMYECFKADKDYEITLTIGGNTYTVTVSKDVTLTNANGIVWYPAKGLIGEKVYGDAQLLANAITLDNYQNVKFLVDPSALTFPEGFAAADETDGEWGVKMLHNHSWSIDVVDVTELVATCTEEGCPYEGGASLRLALGTLEKTYDGKKVSCEIEKSENFDAIFPETVVTTTITKGEDEVDEIKNAGTYQVTVTVEGEGLGDVKTLTATVVIDKAVLTGGTLKLTPNSFTYNASEQKYSSYAAKTAGGLTASGGDVVLDGKPETEIGVYTVTATAAEDGNFKGSVSGTWAIVNTTGALKSVEATSAGVGTLEDNTLTVTDTTALTYADGEWTVGLTLTWPVETKDCTLSQNGHAYYVTEDSAKVTTNDGSVVPTNSDGSYEHTRHVIGGNDVSNFTYLATTTWKVPITPAIIEAALVENRTALEYTMRAGAIVWGDSTEGDPDGVAFADYKISLPLEEPVVFVLGEGETHDLGETVLTTTKIKLAPGASVITTVAQQEGAIFTEETGYEVEWTESEGVYTYTANFTHVHDWSVKVEDGTALVATCTEGCPYEGGVSLSLALGTLEKTYDNKVVSCKIEKSEYFDDAFHNPSATMTITKGGVAVEEIKNAGTYQVTVTVEGEGLGDVAPLTATVVIGKADISDGTLTLTPNELTYTATPQKYSTATVRTSSGTTLTPNTDWVSDGKPETEIGVYTVTATATEDGNFTGSVSGTWKIVNTTGALESVEATSEGVGDVESVGTAEDNTLTKTLTVADTTALEYSYSDGAWTAGLTLTWPMDKEDSGWSNGYAHYISEEDAKVSVSAGEITHVSKSDSFRYRFGVTSNFTYLATTTWTVPITPAIIEAAIADEKTALEYTMRAGAVASDTYEQGVAFADYKIVIPLEGIKLYDENGYQVYPVQSEDAIIDEMKSAIDAAEDLDDTAKDVAKAKVDALVDVAGAAQDVREWIDAKIAGNYGVLAASDYVVASYVLGTEKLITDESKVEFKTVEAVEGGFAIAVTVDGADIEAVRAKAAEIVRSGTDLKTFDKVDAARITVSEDGRLTIAPDSEKDCEFFRLEIDKDANTGK